MTRACGRAGGLLRLAAVWAGVSTSGCYLVVGYSRTGDLLPRASIDAIRHGETTRREVLDWFGPPSVVTRPSAGTVLVPDVGLRRYGAIEAPASSLFEPFVGREVAPRDVVYLFERQSVVTQGGGIAEKGPGLTRFEHDTWKDRLWVLVDGDSGIVKSHVHRSEGPPEDTAPAAGDGASGGPGW